MEIRNLKTFLRVAALQNFTKAAEELGYSQSNVSVQISQLEREVGFMLFDRIGKNVHLTSYGEALIPYAQRIVSSVIELETFMKSDELLGGVLRVGMVNSLMEGSAPYSRQFEAALSAKSLSCRPFLRLQSADTAVRLVERGPFISLLPLYSVQAAVQAGSLSRLNVPEWKGTQFVQMVLYRGKAITPQIRGFLEELSAILNDILPKRLHSAS